MKQYKINSEQLSEIGHYKDMFSYFAECISDLCSEERNDIVYGFRLGEIHSALRQKFAEIMELESQIRHHQKIEEA
jgi:hypothetical protein